MPDLPKALEKRERCVRPGVIPGGYKESPWGDR